jgi:uncharacterized membrane protein YraQ (UPF0718 family)
VIIKVIGIGIGSIVIMMLTETFMAARQRRNPEAGAVVIAGLLGLAYCIGMLYAAGEL